MALDTTTVNFLNRPNEDGTVTSQISVPGCLIAQHGASTARRPQVIIHLPKSFTDTVNGAWVHVEGGYYHVIGTTIGSMIENTPTKWNRYAIAEKIY